MEAKNLKEFKELIERYETITLEEIKETEFVKEYTAKGLTGFGDPKTCSLCKVGCTDCVYGSIISTGEDCLGGENKKTYTRIESADTPLKLRNAFRARAKHMKTLLK